MPPEIFVERCDDYEIIEGEKFMSPSANIKHNRIVGNLVMTIGTYAHTHKAGYVFTDNLDIHFPDGNLFRPDFCFIAAANGKIVLDNKYGTIHGVPDMVAEIFSRSTMQNDVGIKKDAYERNGVKEYWIIDPWRETVEVFILRDGKFESDGLYQNWNDDELARLTDDERAQVKFDVPVAVLDGFKVKIKNIFGWFIE